MLFEIKPYIGVNNIEFGMSQEQVRCILGGDYKLFKRTPSVVFPSDYYVSLGVFVEYKPSGVVEALEFCMPSDVSFNKVSLLSLSFNKLQKFLQIYDDDQLEIENCSMTSYDSGISGYASSCKEDKNAKIESILVFEKGYYG